MEKDMWCVWEEANENCGQDWGFWKGYFTKYALALRSTLSPRVYVDARGCFSWELVFVLEVCSLMCPCASVALHLFSWMSVCKQLDSEGEIWRLSWIGPYGRNSSAKVQRVQYRHSRDQHSPSQILGIEERLDISMNAHHGPDLPGTGWVGGSSFGPV